MLVVLDGIARLRYVEVVVLRCPVFFFFVKGTITNFLELTFRFYFTTLLLYYIQGFLSSEIMPAFSLL